MSSHNAKPDEVRVDIASSKGAKKVDAKREEYSVR